MKASPFSVFLSLFSKWVSAKLTNKKRKSHDTLRGVVRLIKGRQKTTTDKRLDSSCCANLDIIYLFFIIQNNPTK